MMSIADLQKQIMATTSPYEDTMTDGVSLIHFF